MMVENYIAEDKSILLRSKIEKIFGQISVKKTESGLYVAEMPQIYGSDPLIVNENAADLKAKVAVALKVDTTTGFLSLKKLEIEAATEEASLAALFRRAMHHLNTGTKRLYRFVPKPGQSEDDLKDGNYHIVGPTHILHNHDDKRQRDLALIELTPTGLHEWPFEMHQHVMSLDLYPGADCH